MGGKTSKINRTTEIQDHAKQIQLRGNMAEVVNHVRDSSSVIGNLEGILQSLQLKALVTAFKGGNVEAIIKLINEGQVGINDRLGDPKASPLHIAAVMGKAEVIRALLTFPDADVNIQDKDGDTPLMVAIQGADSDAQSVVICGILISDPRCDITKDNDKGVFPICVSLKKKYRETTNLLIAKSRLKAYSRVDLIVAVKVAMTFDQEDIADEIIKRVDVSKWMEVASDLSEDPRMGLLRSLMELQQLLGNLKTDDSDDDKKTSSDEKPVTDYAGHILRQGNTIKTLPFHTMKRENPTDKDEVLEKIANQSATIHDFVGQRLLIQVNDSLIKVNCKSVVFADNGPRQALADGTDVFIGCYVKVFTDEKTLMSLAKGHGGWNEDMAVCCGKTGRILNIDKDSDVMVGFAWGKIFYFNPMCLLESSCENIETIDSSNNWITKGSPARVIESREALSKLQTQNGLPTDEKHLNLTNKYVCVQKVIITPFCRDKDVIVINAKQGYGVNATSLTLVTFAIDHNGYRLRIGSEVKMLTSKIQVEGLQTEEFGNWSDGIEKVLGESGKVVSLDVNVKYNPTDVVVKVKFDNNISLYLNPKALILIQENGATKDDDVAEPPKLKPLKIEPAKSEPDRIPTPGTSPAEKSKQKVDADDLHLQLILRSDLQYGKKLGEGAFGCVYAGSWKGTDCAIKQIKTIVTSQISREQIMKEAKIHFSLKHPNIVQLYGISYDTELWMVMQIVKGKSLQSVIFPDSGDKTQKLQAEQKPRIALQICNGINYIHEKGYLHGDIKPYNMILELATNNIFICDFGISRYLGDMDAFTFANKYTINAGVGTMYYSAPECFKEASAKGGLFLKPTFKADVWSIAVTLFELFTERNLFVDKASIYKCLFLNLNDDVEKQMKTLDPSVRSIVKKGLEQEVELRPTTREMIDFLFNVAKISS